MTPVVLLPNETELDAANGPLIATLLPKLVAPAAVNACTLDEPVVTLSDGTETAAENVAALATESCPPTLRFLFGAMVTLSPNCDAEFTVRVFAVSAWAVIAPVNALVEVTESAPVNCVVPATAREEADSAAVVVVPSALLPELVRPFCKVVAPITVTALCAEPSETVFEAVRGAVKLAFPDAVMAGTETALLKLAVSEKYDLPPTERDFPVATATLSLRLDAAFTIRGLLLVKVLPEAIVAPLKKLAAPCDVSVPPTATAPDTVSAVAVVLCSEVDAVLVSPFLIVVTPFRVTVLVLPAPKTTLPATEMSLRHETGA